MHVNLLKEKRFIPSRGKKQYFLTLVAISPPWARWCDASPRLQRTVQLKMLLRSTRDTKTRRANTLLACTLENFFFLRNKTYFLNQYLRKVKSIQIWTHKTFQQNSSSKHFTCLPIRKYYFLKTWYIALLIVLNSWKASIFGTTYLFINMNSL